MIPGNCSGLWALLGIALLILTGVARSAPPPGVNLELHELFATRGATRLVGPYEDSSLGNIKLFFRLLYNEKRERVLASVGSDGPVLYVSPSLELQLFRNGGHDTFQLLAKRWADVASISHSALSVHLLLKAWVDRPLQPLVRRRLKVLIELARKARVPVASSDWPAEVRQSQLRILGEVLEFSERVVRQNSSSGSDLRQFAYRVRADIGRGVNYAESALIDELYAMTLRVRHRLTKADWRRLRVLIHSTPAPRAESALTLFFAAALGTGICSANGLLPGESRRVLYSEESPPGEKGAWQNLATTVLDETFAQDFFGDVLYMRRDATRSGVYTKLSSMSRLLPIP